MTSSRYWPLSRMSREYSLYFVRAQRAEHGGFHDLGKADDGVERRAQLVAHIGEEFRFGLVGVLGAGLFLGVFFGEVGELIGLQLQRLLRFAQVADGRDLAFFALDQLLLVQLDLGDIGADRDIAAVLGAPFADMHPAPVVELGFEGAGAGRLDVVAARPWCAGSASCRRRRRSRSARRPAPPRRAGGAAPGNSNCTAPGDCRRPTARRLPGWSRWRRAAASPPPWCARPASSAR